ncbi:hypothetical protein [Endozoicomonas arenosclerae]|uniref:hypothetical protein n=1 Tax=Endozoicomonas arenosclerae TaxID=1633495 RepID=UPI000A7AB319|nr:hypothetical protein [Endozoicomonas arenosclerae]
MKKIIPFFITIIFSSYSYSAVFWTVKATGIHTTTSGTVAINIGSSTPTGANPSGTEWESCDSNWIFFHKKADGSMVNEKYVDRMLSVAMSSFKTGSRLRLGISRDVNGKCYTSQIYDLGN